MDQNLSQKKSILALILVVLIGLSWLACTTVKERQGDPAMGQDKEGGKYYFFDDVLIPKELNYKSDTPRKAGGLMSGAASKAVDPVTRLCAKAGLRTH